MGRKDKNKAKEADAEMDAQDTALDDQAEAAREDEASDSNEMSDAEKVTLEAGRMRIRINVAVNGHRPNDRLVVDRDHPFYSALVNQKLAEIVEEGS